MTTQNQYTPEVIQLQGGLDFVSPRPSAAPGSLIDGLNFEVADRLGYKRVDGIERFDGSPSISNIYNSLYTSIFDTFVNLVVGDYIYLNGDNQTQAFAVVTSFATVGSDKVVTYYVFDLNKFYAVYTHSNTSVHTHNASGTNNFVMSTTQSKYLSAGSTTITTAISDLVSAYQVAHDFITPPSSHGYENAFGSFGQAVYTPPVGLHWFNDQLYAVTDLDSILFDTGVTQLFPNDILNIDRGGLNLLVLVRDYQLTSGSFSGGNAAGKILISYVTVGDYNIDAKRQSLLTLADGTAIALVRGSSTTNAQLVYRTSSPVSVPDTWVAGLFRSVSSAQMTNKASWYTSQGWQEVETGYQYPFDSGTINGPPTLPGRNAIPIPAALQTSSSTVGTSGVTVLGGGILKVLDAAPGGGNWSAHAATTAAANVDIATQNDSKWIRATVNNAVGVTAAPLLLSNFSFPNIPADAIITGITVHLGAYMTNYGAGTSQQTAQVAAFIPTQLNAPTTKTSATITSTSQVATTSLTLGNTGDTWGIDGLTPANVNTLEVEIIPYCTRAGTISVDWHLDYILVDITYQKSSSVYYFYNGADDVQAVITNSYVQSGSWTGANAAGVMQVAQVQPYSTSPRSQISSGDIIRTAPAGAGLAIATVRGNMSFAGLPSLSQTTAVGSRYQMIDANFYGNKDWDAIYGVSGAGRAFVYDSFFFRYIYTGLTDALDLPRHIVFHNFHLGLGYQVGALLTSVTGLPENFSGVSGAGEFDFGDAITGLLRMNGTTLGVFCQRSVQALNGTSNENFSTSILSPHAGAIEYTVVDCGGKPVFATYNGISTLDQTNAYGNFLGSRLSHQISPWLLPRLTNQTPRFQVDSNSFATRGGPGPSRGPLFAQAIRSKNQYRLWFADGYYLTLTLVGPEAAPVFTTQQIDFRTGSMRYLVPLAYSSDVDSNGLERNHISCYDVNAGKGTTRTATQNYVYEIDRGWGWTTVPIQAWFTSTHNFFDNPFVISTIRKIRLHGQSLGAASLAVAVSSDYHVNDFTFGNLYGQTASNAIPQDVSLPIGGFNNSPATLTSDYQPETSIANVGKTGRSFTLQFSTDPYVGLGHVEPPSIAQALLIQITEAKADI